MTPTEGHLDAVVSGKRRKSWFDVLPFEMGYLPPKFQRKAEIELNETPENIKNGLRQLREMIPKDKNLEGQHFSDDFLLLFLRGRKYNIANVFSTLQSFVALRKKNFEMFNKVKFESLVEATSRNIMTVLPKRCSDGCAIIRVELERWDPCKIPLEEAKKIILLLFAQSVRDPMTQVNGFKFIVNVKSNPLKYLRFCTPSNLHLMCYGALECSPGRYKEVHLVNESIAFQVVWAMVKPFLTNKIKKRIIFHSSPKTVADYFPRIVLPVEYGGDLKDVDMTPWIGKVTQPDILSTIGWSHCPLSLNKSH